MPAKTSKRIDPWRALDALMKSNEPTGDGWFSADEFHQRYGNGRSYNWAVQRLGYMARCGLVERWKGRREGRPGLFNKYRLK